MRTFRITMSLGAIGLALALGALGTADTPPTEQPGPPTPTAACTPRTCAPCLTEGSSTCTSTAATSAPDYIPCGSLPITSSPACIPCVAPESAACGTCAVCSPCCAQVGVAAALKPSTVADAPPLVEEFPELVRTLIGMLKNDTDEQSVLHIKRTLRRLGPEAVPQLVAMLDSGNSDERNQAVRVLPWLCKDNPYARKALPALLKLAGDADDEQRERVLRAIEAIARANQRDAAGQPKFGPNDSAPLMAGELVALEFTLPDGSHEQLDGCPDLGGTIVVYPNYFVIESDDESITMVRRYAEIKELILLR